ncbi:MAG: DegV family protein [Dehalococcoidia bacterium]|nr:DegV family protein [Dehalococcoidia bacterium]
MQIVTDSGTDLCLPAEEVKDLNIHVLPLVVTLEGKSYREGVDMNAEDFYKLLASTESFPTTSTPSPGDFAGVYKKLATADPDILSIHMSSGLSGTFNSARVAAESVPEANVTVIDTKTLSAAAGWQVSSAARAIKAGWQKEKILSLIGRVSAASDSLYTLNDLKYLIHGGRISHMKGLIASLLNIRPIIGVEKVKGTYVQMGQSRTFKRAVEGLVDLISRKHAPGSALRAQVLHAANPEGAGTLRELVDKRFACNWLPTSHLSLVLGAHTGTSMVGVAYAAAELLADMP